MSTGAKSSSGYWSAAWEAWNRFWFEPSDPATLSLIRVLTGAMLFYTHLVWTLDLEAFFGPNGWLPPDLMRQMHAGRPFTWSFFNLIGSTGLLWTVHLLALAVFFLLMVGFCSRTVSVLAFLIAMSYANRVTPGGYFGLDKINVMLALYLMLGPSGARYSLDRIWRLRRGRGGEAPASSAANIAIRLIQLHMAIIYFFSGLGKLQGLSWWDGEAVWMSVANLEYQTLDMTWLADHWWIVNLMTHITVFWELSYCFLVWNRFARPWVLLLAVVVHGGIALALGMATFGLVMLIGNLAFVSPARVRRVVDPLANRLALALAGSGAA